MRRLRSALDAVKRFPSNSISPAVGSSSPVMQPIVVLLPLPFGPRNPNIAPARTASDRFSTATVAPYFFSTLVKRIASMRSIPSFHHSQQPFAAGRKQTCRDFQRIPVQHHGQQGCKQNHPPVLWLKWRAPVLIEHARSENRQHHAANHHDVAEKGKIIPDGVLVIPLAWIEQRY